MKHSACVVGVACAVLLAGCVASMPPTELVSARQAYEHASVGNAAELVPEEFRRAHEALQVAERSFQNDPRSILTRDLAYLAYRKAALAAALATTASDSVVTAGVSKDFRSAKTEIVKPR
jgi:Domain of unknown function (DUF4398)